jgi:hypothetical protein
MSFPISIVFPKDPFLNIKDHLTPYEIERFHEEEEIVLRDARLKLIKKYNRYIAKKNWEEDRQKLQALKFHQLQIMIREENIRKPRVEKNEEDSVNSIIDNK